MAMEDELMRPGPAGDGQNPASLPAALQNIPGLNEIFMGAVMQQGNTNLAKDLMTMGNLDRANLDYILRSVLTMEELRAVCHFHATLMAIRSGRVDWEVIMLIYIVGKAAIDGRARNEYLTGITGGPIRAVRSGLSGLRSAFRKSEAQNMTAVE